MTMVVESVQVVLMTGATLVSDEGPWFWPTPAGLENPAPGAAADEGRGWTVTLTTGREDEEAGAVSFDPGIVPFMGNGLPAPVGIGIDPPHEPVPVPWKW